MKRFGHHFIMTSIVLWCVFIAFIFGEIVNWCALHFGIIGFFGSLALLLGIFTFVLTYILDVLWQHKI